MSTRSIAELKSFYGKQKPTSENSGYWDKFYSFFKMDFDQTAIVRFLPDLDDSNPAGFLVENLYHKLTVNGREKTVACLKMYNEPCPCCELSRKYYGEKNETLGLKYWHKKEFVGQVLVIDSPFEHVLEEGANPVRLISIGPKIFKNIQNAFESGDLQENPCDLMKGYNFRIKKTKQGQYADYSTSSFAPMPSAVPDALLSRIQLFNLADWRYKKVEREEMEAMIEADRTGASIPEGEKPTGAKWDAPKASPTLTTETASTVVTGNPVAETAAATGSSNAQELLARIRSRNANK